MILTGKSKEDFEKYQAEKLNKQVGFSACYIEGAIEQDIYEIFEDLPLSMQLSFAIEWLDSVGIYIGFTYFKLGGGYFEWRIHYTRYFGHSNTRQEATEEAIKQANIIYNERYENKHNTTN